MTSQKNIFPAVLLGLYIIEFVLLGIDPVSRTTWIVENTVALIPVFTLYIMWLCGIRFSNTAYFAVWLYFTLHTVGGHYTFEKVPFGFVTDFFGFERNHFDRICHFLVGSFAYPFMEYLESRKLVRGHALLMFIAVMSIFGLAAIFELVEWIYAELAAPEAGEAFLGSQGDVWDAQKDMLSDGIGAIVFSSLYLTVNRNKKSGGQTENN